jgi:hypothetical protein
LQIAHCKFGIWVGDWGLGIGDWESRRVLGTEY